MTLLIISVLLLIIAILAIFFTKKITVNGNNIGKYFRVGGFILIGIICIMLGISSFTTVESGTVKIQKLFGVYQEGYLSEGVHLINPFSTTETTNIQRNAITVQDGDQNPGMSSTTKDEIQANVQANFSFSFNQEYVWWLRTYIGADDKVISQIVEKAAQSATRDVLASYTLQEARITKRSKLEKDLTDAFYESIISNLPQNKGINSKFLRSVIVVLPTQLMDIKPDEKVINALNEKKATEINLDRQKTLTLIAKEAANRRQQEGQGIKRMFDQLPNDYTAQDVAFVLDASANKTRAEAMLKAVEDGKVSSIIFEGTAARTK